MNRVRIFMAQFFCPSGCPFIATLRGRRIVRVHLGEFPALTFLWIIEGGGVHHGIRHWRHTFLSLHTLPAGARRGPGQLALRILNGGRSAHGQQPLQRAGGLSNAAHCNEIFITLLIVITFIILIGFMPFYLNIFVCIVLVCGNGTTPLLGRNV